MEPRAIAKKSVELQSARAALEMQDQHQTREAPTMRCLPNRRLFKEPVTKRNQLWRRRAFGAIDDVIGQI